ncbi:hypothetical protein GCM10027414_36810 [Humibacter ginsengiterrae]
MKRRALAGVLGIAAVLALAGCSQNTDQNTVDHLAVQKASQDLPNGDHATVADTWSWRGGYAVLVKTEGKNSSGPYTYWKAYGYQQQNGSWKLTASNLVDDAKYPPGSTPHKATCFALAGSDYGEQQQCEQLTD